ncbi:hypothetical protein PIB30_009162 [Stylosanthes scabra]|uniref:Uncharacterized protein n=1 Tax=Stylosanthes scabra TaxID=79078 RepID=A0ABU6Y5D0_9FABA|nr:hypothetical protein [Stylosanthes scabra]
MERRSDTHPCMPIVIPTERTSGKRKQSASRPDLVGVGASSNPSPQTPIHSSPNSQYSKFANSRGLDAIGLHDDEIENQRQEGTPHWHWEEDEMLISAWLNISTDPVVGKG